MTPLRQRMIEDMQLRGSSARTQECYVSAARQLAGDQLFFALCPGSYEDESFAKGIWTQIVSKMYVNARGFKESKQLECEEITRCC